VSVAGKCRLPGDASGGQIPARFERSAREEKRAVKPQSPKDKPRIIAKPLSSSHLSLAFLLATSCRGFLPADAYWMVLDEGFLASGRKIMIASFYTPRGIFSH
jgi:hypothetical protein